MFTCGNKALVVGDGTAIMKLGFPTNNQVERRVVNVWLQRRRYLKGIAIEFVLFEKETRQKNVSLVHVPQNYINNELTLALCRSTIWNEVYSKLRGCLVGWRRCSLDWFPSYLGATVFDRFGEVISWSLGVAGWGSIYSRVVVRCLSAVVLWNLGVVLGTV
jgi:hypothetical protein